MHKSLLILGCYSTLLAGAAFAQQVEEQTTVVKEKHSGTAAGAVAGAATGAVVAGPVGAVVGGVAGAVVGHTVAPPTEVRTYVTAQNVPVTHYGHDIVVGHTIDGDVEWREVPDYPRYHWAYLDGRRVVVDDSHRVVEVY